MCCGLIWPLPEKFSLGKMLFTASFYQMQWLILWARNFISKFVLLISPKHCYRYIGNWLCKCYTILWPSRPMLDIAICLRVVGLQFLSSIHGIEMFADGCGLNRKFWGCFHLSLSSDLCLLLKEFGFGGDLLLMFLGDICINIVGSYFGNMCRYSALYHLL